MRKLWYLNPQLNNLLHLVDDIAVPIAEFWRRIATSSAWQILLYQLALMIVFGIAAQFLMRYIIRRQTKESLHLIRTLEYYFVSRGY